VSLRNTSVPAGRSLALLAAVAVGAVVAVSSGAPVARGAMTSRSTSATASSFCSVSRDVAKSLVHAASGLTASSAPAALKAKYEVILKAEPKLLGSAPGSIKPSLKKVLAFVNFLAAKLKAASWQITGLASSITVLEAKANAATPSLDRLGRYYRSACKFHV
jgi:hypothetical protein